jgi:hypothetical protein
MQKELRNSTEEWNVEGKKNLDHCENNICVHFDKQAQRMQDGYFVSIKRSSRPVGDMFQVESTV